MAEGTLLLIDANSILNRAFFGLTGRGGLRAPDGTPTNALYAFLTIYWKFLEETGATHACAAFDLPVPTFRHLRDANYKATRRPMPDDLAVQMPIMKELLDAMGVQRVEKAGYEADDLIGTVSRKAAEAGLHVLVLTGDRDALQLVDDRVTVLLPTTKGGRTETERFDPAAVRGKYGLDPGQLIELKSIMGDASDNIPGVHGIGEKGALELVRRYGSLEGVYAALDEVSREKPAMGARLAQDRESADLSRWLATIDRDAPVDVPIESLRLQPMDPERIRPVFQRLGFRSFLQRFSISRPATGDAEAARPMPTEGREALQAALGRGAVPEALAGCQDGSCSIAFNDDSVVILPSLQVESGIREILRAHGADPSGATSEASNASAPKAFLACPDAKALLKAGLPESLRTGTVARTLFDPGIAAYVLGSDSTRKSLHVLYETLTGKPAPEFGEAAEEPAAGKPKAPEQTDLFSLVQPEPLLQGSKAAPPDSGPTADDAARARLAAASAALQARAVAMIQRRSIEERGLRFLLEDVEMPLAGVLAGMERVGFRVDGGILAGLSEQLLKRQAELEAEVHGLCGTTFNINSPKQLADVLFVRLGLPASRRTATGFSTDSDALEAIADRHEAVSRILEFRQVSKLRATFVDGLLKVVSPEDGRVHTTFHQTATATGRLSSTDPNLQNIPVRMEQGREIRRAFVPEPGRVLIDADYSQIELRLMAHFSGDDDMVRAFRENVDIHRETAAKVFRVPLDLVTPSMRTRAKAVNFGILYGIGEYSLSRDIGSSIPEAKRIIDDYYRQFPAVKEYLERTVEEAKRTGWVETLFGRRRPLPELASPNRQMRSFGERAAMNTPLQGTAADIIKIAMVRTADALAARGMRTRLVLQVHDELILEAPAAEVAEASALLQECMEGAADLKVPLRVDVKSGASWFETK